MLKLILPILGFLWTTSAGAYPISTGTSYLSCLQDTNCQHDMEIYGVDVVLKDYPWFEGHAAPVIRVTQISQTDFELIIKLAGAIDVPNLKDTYGCPDCNDGGSEWINFGHKKVVFEALKPPSELKDLYCALRTTAKNLNFYTYVPKICTTTSASIKVDDFVLKTLNDF